MIDLRYEKPLRVPDAIALLGICERTLNNWFDAGLEKLKIGGKVYTSVEAVQRFSVDATAPRLGERLPTKDEIQADIDELDRLLAERRKRTERSRNHERGRCPVVTSEAQLPVAAMA